MFGLPTSILLEQEKKQKHGNGETGSGNGVAKKERWGDASVGLHNYGVNGGLSDPGAIQIATSGLAVELGSGSLDKTRHLLRSMAKLLQPRSKSSPSGIMNDIEYKALDLEAASLYSTLSSLASIEGESVTTSLQDHIPTRRVSVSGLHATYDEGLAFLKEQNSRPRRPSDPLVSPDMKPTVTLDRLPDTIDEESEASSSPPLAPVPDQDEEQRKTSILWLGSSIGNFTREEAVDFLKGIHLAEGDTMLIGVDGCDNGPEIEVAYNDPEVCSLFFPHSLPLELTMGSSYRVLRVISSLKESMLRAGPFIQICRPIKDSALPTSNMRIVGTLLSEGTR